MAHAAAKERQSLDHRVADEQHDEPARAIPGGLGPDQFKAAFRNHPAGVAVITANSPSGPVALTATSVISVSAEPPLLVFSLSALSSATPTLRDAETLVVHLLGVPDIGLAKLCSTSGADRFADSSTWSLLPTGEPLFHGVGTWIRGRVIDRMEAGKSTILAVHALEAGLTLDPAAEPTPLVYHNRTWHGLGAHSQL